MTLARSLQSPERSVIVPSYRDMLATDYEPLPALTTRAPAEGAVARALLAVLQDGLGRWYFQRR